MTTIQLKEIAIQYGDNPHYVINCNKAELFLMTDYGNRFWYINIDGIADHALLRRFSQSDDIRVTIAAASSAGAALSGSGYLHPNELNSAAAIRGDGELNGL